MKEINTNHLLIQTNKLLLVIIFSLFCIFCVLVGIYVLTANNFYDVLSNLKEISGYVNPPVGPRILS